MAPEDTSTAELPCLDTFQRRCLAYRAETRWSRATLEQPLPAQIAAENRVPGELFLTSEK
jgi:hypothetical protein